LLRYYHVVKTLVDNFNCFEMYHIPRESNIGTYLLSKLPSTKKIRHLQNHHPGDTPSTNHRHQGGHGRRKG